MKSIIKKSNIEGIYYIIDDYGSNRFLKIIHKLSQTAIINFTSAPVLRTTDIIKESEMILSTVDWNVKEKELTEKHGEAVKMLMNRIYIDGDLNKYVVKDTPQRTK